jgi:ABC-type glycerol-3-phosphate transport system substrate-binding protein
MLHDEGFIEKESPVLSDDNYAASWAKGKYLVTGWFPAWAPVYFKSAIDQGVITEPHRYAFVRFPAGEGVDYVPAATSFPGVVVIKDEDEEVNKLAARLAWYMNNTEYQEITIKRNQTYGNRKSVNVQIDDPYWKQIDEIVDANGTLDLGLTTQTFSAVRTQMFPRLQDLWNGKQTPEEALAAYEAGVNKILRGE